MYLWRHDNQHYIALWEIFFLPETNEFPALLHEKALTISIKHLNQRNPIFYSQN